MTHQDYETIDADKHNALTYEEQVELLKARVKELMQERDLAISRYNQLAENPTGDYTKSPYYEPYD